MPFDKRDNWAQGANNRAMPTRIPQGFVREAVNFDARPTGELVARPGYTQLQGGTDIRFARVVGDTMVIVDGDQVIARDLLGGTTRTLGTVAGTGTVAGDTLGNELFFCTANQTLRTDGTALHPWGVEPPRVELQVVAGSCAAGVYKVAATSTGARGEESGAIPKVIRLDAGQGLRVTTSDASARVYCSAVDSETLYYQGDAIAGAYVISAPYDDAERLDTAYLLPPPVGTMVTAFRSMLLVAQGRAVYVTAAFAAHLTDPVRGFYQFPASVTNVVRSVGGVYITAGHTYFLSALETDEPVLVTAAEHDGVAGTGVTLPDGKATWFTEYGQAFGDGSGSVEFPNKKHYAPRRAARGAAGVVEHHGGHTVVTTLAAGIGANSAATADYCDLEVVKL